MQQNHPGGKGTLDGTGKSASTSSLSESAFRRAIDDAILAGLAAVGMDGRQSYVNKAFSDMVGWPEEELVGADPPFVYWPEEEIPNILEAFRQTLEGAAPRKGFELRFRRKNGERFDALVSVAPMEGEDRSMQGWLASVSDITEQKRVEAALRESERQLRDSLDSVQRLNRDLKHRVDELQGLLDVSPIGLALSHDPQCQLITVNPAFARMLDIEPGMNASKSAPEGSQLGFRVLKDGRELAPEELPMQRAAAEDVEIREFEEEVRHVSGRSLSLLAYATPLHDENGEVRGVLGAFVDITQMKEAEVRITESESRFRSLANSIPQIVWVSPHRGTTNFVNEQWKRLSGLTLEQTLDPEWMIKVIHPDDLRKLYDRWTAAEESLTQFEVEYRLRHVGGGDYRWFLARSLPIKDEEGRVVEWFGTATDIHEFKLTQTALEEQTRLAREEVAERRRVERELRELNETLEARVQERTAELMRSNRELQDFAHVASHDLQEPLRKITSFVDLLIADHAGELSPDGLAFIRRIQNSAIRMSELINDLLVFSRLRTRVQQFKRVDLRRVVEEVLSDLEVQIREANGVVEIGDLPEIDADAIQMRQLFQNLIGNALKFRRDSDAPVIRIRSDRSTHGNEPLRLIFEDNGIGFDERYADRIFSPFQRLHERQSYPGSGMGLAICRRIVERHSGEITAHSTPGAGSSFVVTLPVRQRSSHSSDEES